MRDTVPWRRLLANQSRLIVQSGCFDDTGSASGGLPVMQRDSNRDQAHRDGSAPLLTALFIDYDNIYQALKRANDDAAARFSKDAVSWLKAIEQGTLISPTHGGRDTVKRRLVMNRCYGNPVPQKNGRDNLTDSNSFAFVRHYFLRAGFEVIDCPPLTARLKNSSDIRMVMDVRDFLTHETYFDEFIIMSGDADFTPVLHRLRAHARRTVIFANENTSTPYKAISDGEIRAVDLVEFLLSNKAAQPAHEQFDDGAAAHAVAHVSTQAIPSVSHAGPPVSAAEQYASAYASANPASQRAPVDFDSLRRQIVDIVKATLQEANDPVAIELLADRAQRSLGHELTVGTQWAGAGSFRAFLGQHLPQHLRVTEHAPYQVYTVGLGTAIEALSQRAPGGERSPGGERMGNQATALQQAPILARPRMLEDERGTANLGQPSLGQSGPAAQPLKQPHAANGQARTQLPDAEFNDSYLEAPITRQARGAAPNVPPNFVPNLAPAGEIPMQPPRRAALKEQPIGRIEQSIARIHEACQAPPLSPPDYRILFDTLAAELSAHGLQGQSTIGAVVEKARASGLDAKLDDVRFVLDVVREADPWFEKGASGAILASRFRNYVVSRCRAKGLSLSVDEIDLIDAWFAASPGTLRATVTVNPATPFAPTMDRAPPALVSGGKVGQDTSTDQWWAPPATADSHDDFDAMPRIIRSRA
jgi:NYN domain